MLNIAWFKYLFSNYRALYRYEQEENVYYYISIPLMHWFIPSGAKTKLEISLKMHSRWNFLCKKDMISEIHNILSLPKLLASLFRKYQNYRNHYIISLLNNHKVIHLIQWNIMKNNSPLSYTTFAISWNYAFVIK